MVDLTEITATAATVFRDSASPGSATPHEPIKSEIRSLFGDVGEAISLAMEAGSGAFIVKSTVAVLDADLNHDAGVYARVIADDQSPPENGYYLKSGASGTGSWAFVAQDPAVLAAEEAEASATAAAASAVEALTGVSAPRFIGFGASHVQRNASGDETGGDEIIYTRPVGVGVWGMALYPYCEADVWFDNTGTLDYRGAWLGYPGETASQVLTHIADATRLAPDIAYLEDGGNGIEAGNSAAVEFQALQDQAEEFRAGGARVLLATIKPRSGWTVGSAKFLVKEDVNAQIEAYCAAGNARLVPLHDALADGTGMPLSGVLEDGVHLSPLGAYIGARDALVPSLKTVQKSVLKDGPRSANLVTNPTMSGTGGTSGTGVTGTVGDDWQAVCSGCTAVGAIVSGERQFTLTPGGAASEALVLGSTVGVTVTPERWVRAYIDLRLSAWDGWSQPELLIENADGASLALNRDASALMDNDGSEVVLRLLTPPYLVPAGITLLSIAPRIWIDGTAAGTGVVTIEEIRVGEVADPRPLHGY